ncbi:MAG: hypothetical protein OXF22_10785 [Anaerolineaceae bacterium]|nr:hypothetical protein [Anaerolineaceae bacterium]
MWDIRWQIRWFWLVVLFLLGISAGIAGTVLFQRTEQSLSPTSPPEEFLSILPLSAPFSLTEELITIFPFSPEYPRVPCATWENEGLAWWWNDWLEEPGWAIRVWWPIWRFCGIPQPHPDKPDLDQARELAPPEEWSYWREAPLLWDEGSE